MTEDKNIKDELLMDPFKQADDSDDSLVLEPEKQLLPAVRLTVKC